MLSMLSVLYTPAQNFKFSLTVKVDLTPSRCPENAISSFDKLLILLLFRPAMCLKSVVFPDPFGPFKIMHSPDFKLNVTSATTSMWPRLQSKFLISSNI